MMGPQFHPFSFRFTSGTNGQFSGLVHFKTGYCGKGRNRKRYKKANQFVPRGAAAAQEKGLLRTEIIKRDRRQCPRMEIHACSPLLFLLSPIQFNWAIRELTTQYNELKYCQRPEYLQEISPSKGRGWLERGQNISWTWKRWRPVRRKDCSWRRRRGRRGSRRRRMRKTLVDSWARWTN